MEVLHEIAEIIGAGQAVKLGQAMGGARIYVPAKAAYDHPLSIILGVDTAQRLCDYYRGDVMEIPSKRIFRRVRNDIIYREYHNMILDKGCKADALALKFGISRRQVLNIAKLAA